MTSLAPTLQAYFTTRLTKSQYGASPHTVAAYRDTWRLLLGFTPAHRRPGPPLVASSGPVPGLDADPDQRSSSTDLETQRGNSIATRNARLAAARPLSSPTHRAIPTRNT